MKKIIFALLLGASISHAQIPAPQVPLTGTAGAGGNFPFLNSGSFAMTTDANYTVAYPNTTCIVCNVTSTVSLTATRNLIEPAQKMTFNITNSTSGAQTIVVKAATGSGVTVANGTSKWVWFNGTNYVEIDPPGGGGGSGTVTSVAVTTANGVSGTVADPSTTPAITLTLGDITPTSVTDSSLGGTTQCVESVAGVLTGTGSACGSGSGGTNITVNGGSALSSPVNFESSSGSGGLTISNPSGSNVQAVITSPSITVQGAFCGLGGSCSLPDSSTSFLGVSSPDGTTIGATGGVYTVQPTTINGTECTPGSSCSLPTFCAGFSCANYNQNNPDFTANVETLTAAFSSTDLTMTMASTTGIPAPACGLVSQTSIGIEYLCWDTKTATTLTIDSLSERGLNHTTALSFLTGAGLNGMYYSQARCPDCTQTISILANGQIGYNGSLNPQLGAQMFLPAGTFATGQIYGNGPWLDEGAFRVVGTSQFGNSTIDTTVACGSTAKCLGFSTASSPVTAPSGSYATLTPTAAGLYYSANGSTPTLLGGGTVDTTYYKAATEDGGTAFSSSWTRYDNNQPQTGSVASATSSLAYFAYQAAPTLPQYAELAIDAPPYWTGTSLYIKFFTSVTTGNVIWDVQFACIPDGTPLTSSFSPTFSTPVQVTTTVNGTAYGLTTTALVSDIAAPGDGACPSSPTTPTQIIYRIYRDDSDTAAADVNFLGTTFETARSR